MPGWGISFKKDKDQNWQILAALYSVKLLPLKTFGHLVI